jgi:exopolysaccharide biosynthesis predicted pyruvyltransferase EpsI
MLPSCGVTDQTSGLKQSRRMLSHSSCFLDHTFILITGLTLTNHSHDIIILSRDDWEVSSGNSSIIPYGTGTINLGGRMGNVTYRKIDWNYFHTPGIDKTLPAHLKGKVQGLQKSSDFPEKSETGRNQRAYAKALAGFELLASGKFVITDRLHGHIMSTIIGTPHVLMDSKSGANLDFHDTWTQECECTRITPDFETSLKVARLYLESIKETDRV